MGDRINREVAMSRRDKEIETEATQQAHYIQWGLIMVGGPAVEFAANIFEYQKKSFVQTTTKQAETSGNKWKQADHGLMGGSAFDHDLFPPPLPPPLIKKYHSLHRYFSSGCDAVVSAKFA